MIYTDTKLLESSVAMCFGGKIYANKLVVNAKRLAIPETRTL